MAHTSNDLALPNVVNNFGSTTLAISINNVATSVELADASALSATGGIISINAEIIKFESRTGNVLNNCVRGLDGTTATSHTAGDTVNSYVVAHSFNQLKSELQLTQADVGGNETGLSNHIAATGAHGVSTVMGTTETQASENKTHSKMTYAISDNAATGASATVTPASTSVRLTDGSLTSIEGIVPTTHKVLTLMNATGSPISILNDTGTAANRILTGTGSAIDLENDASILLVYDSTTAKFRIAGGSGAGGLTPTVIDDSFAGTIEKNKWYIVDLSAATVSLTLNLQAGASKANWAVTTYGMSNQPAYATTPYFAVLTPNGTEKIWYDEAEWTSLVVGQNASTVRAAWDNTNSWVCDVSDIFTARDLSGTWTVDGLVFPNNGTSILDNYSEGTWTPNFTGITEVGTPTYSGAYTRIGRAVIFTVTMTAGTTIEASLGDYCDLPFQASIDGTCHAVDFNSLVSYGVGHISSATNRAYVPAFSAVAKVVLTGMYHV